MHPSTLNEAAWWETETQVVLDCSASKGQNVNKLFENTEIIFVRAH